MKLKREQLKTCSQTTLKFSTYSFKIINKFWNKFKDHRSLCSTSKRSPKCSLQASGSPGRQLFIPSDTHFRSTRDVTLWPMKGKAKGIPFPVQVPQRHSLPSLFSSENPWQPHSLKPWSCVGFVLVFFCFHPKTDEHMPSWASHQQPLKDKCLLNESGWEEGGEGWVSCFKMKKLSFYQLCSRWIS